MAKLSTISESTINQAVNFVVDKVHTWTSSELERMSFSKSGPNCIAISDTHIKVGNHTIKQINDSCWRLISNEITHDFIFKKSAIFYSLARQQKMFDLAFKIIDNDTKLAAHLNDFNLFSGRLKSSNVTDKFKRQLYMSRKKQAYSQYLVHRTQLLKSLKLAKYYKLYKPLD